MVLGGMSEPENELQRRRKLRNMWLDGAQHGAETSALFFCAVLILLYFITAWN